MKYQTGKIIELGDRVIIEGGKTPGIVHAIIETDEAMQQWGVDEQGLLLESKPFGLVFWKIQDDDPVILVCRMTAEQKASNTLD